MADGLTGLVSQSFAVTPTLPMGAITSCVIVVDAQDLYYRSLNVTVDTQSGPSPQWTFCLTWSSPTSIKDGVYSEDKSPECLHKSRKSWLTRFYGADMARPPDGQT
ncbi:hypothetical protein ElyMa_005998400 [Elysia marginata]|uniref:Uncharacterized protein n=1 Tax=Elysia marginata TaxID=1093978 RepID=A0AAV4GFT9_9GAST|nr:hypothetical protein ElyMa_005998400 [Elysia marginata]